MTSPQARLDHYRAMPLNELLRYRDSWQRAVVTKIPLTAQQRRVLDVVVEHIGISDSSGYSKGICKLTNSAIAEHAGIEGSRVDERVRRHLKPLLDAKALLVTQRGVGGSGRLKRARHMTMGELNFSTPTKSEGQPPQTAGQGANVNPHKPLESQPPQTAGQPPQTAGQGTKTANDTPQNEGQPPQNEGQPPQNCGGSLDQRSSRDKKTTYITHSTRTREGFSVEDLLRMRDEHFTTMGVGALWDVAWEREVLFAPALTRFIASLPTDSRSDDWAGEFARWIDSHPGGLRRRTVGVDEWRRFEEMAPSPFAA